MFLTQVFLAQIASRVLPSFALGKIFVDDVTSDKVRKSSLKGQGNKIFTADFFMDPSNQSTYSICECF
jgi:hypothetical protein